MERMERLIFHVDVNAFFASVEQRDNPALAGKPVAVAGAGKRTVILTASYEARAFGVRTGMRVPDALNRCPQLLLVPAHNEKYVRASERILVILRSFSPDVEVFSIDEAFVDMTGSAHLFGGPLEAARRMKARIRNDLGLTCSVGIAPTRVLAKLAGDLQKPDGLVWLKPAEIAARLKDLDVGMLWGVGPKGRTHLAAMGIRTIGELAACPQATLAARFGKYGEYLYEVSHGLDAAPVVRVEDEPDAKSVGHSLTLSKDVHTKPDLSKYLLQVSEEVARRMRRGGYSGRTVAVTLRYSTFETRTRRATLKAVTQEGKRIYGAAAELLERWPLKPLGVRLVGVAVSHLVRDNPQPLLLPADEKERRLNTAMDAINDRFGEFTLKRAEVPAREAVKRPIPPSWRPPESRRGRN